MRKWHRRLFASTALVFVVSFGLSSIASAQSVTYVSMTGDDANDCTILSTPCRSVTSAINAVSQFGTVIIQGPYNTANPTVSKSVTIIGQGTVVLRSISFGQNAKFVKIDNLNFEGQNIVGNALNVSGSAKVNISNSSFNYFTDAAVIVNGALGTRLGMNHVEMYGNRYGVLVIAEFGAPNAAFIEDTNIDGSTISAVEARGANSTAVLVSSTLSGSGQLDLSLVNGGKAISYKNNVIRSGAPTQTLPEN